MFKNVPSKHWFPALLPRVQARQSKSMLWRILCIACLANSGLNAWTTHAADGLEVDQDVLEAQNARIEVMGQAASATISIFGLKGDGGGSGVIISPDGYALTNYHVSSACGDHMRCGLNDGKLYDATIVGIDATGDLSLIKLLGREDFPTAPLADSSQVRIGDWCFAAGNPFVLATNLQPSVSLGMVSGVNRYQYPAGTLLEYADCIQTDAAVNPGNSGGPLFNMRGEVIGINGRCSFEKRGRVNVGVGYAISANQAKFFLDTLRSGRLVDHATLGATVSTDDDGQVVVSNILTDSDVYRRGLRYGDTVVSLADREVVSTNTFKNILGTLPKGWRVPLVIRREGRTQTLLVRLEGVHTEQQLTELLAAESAAPPQDPGKEEEDEEGEQDSEKTSAFMPDVKAFEAHYEPKVGYANFYFNRTAQERLWQEMEVKAEFDEQARWVLKGKLVGESTPITIVLDADEATIQVGSRSAGVDFEQAISAVINKRNGSSTLVALRALRELLARGPNQLGDSVYLGAYPTYVGRSRVLADQPRHEVIRTMWYDARVHTSFNPESGRISLMEVYGDLEDDPAEVYFDDYKPVSVGKAQSPLPHRLRLQFGDQPVLVFEVNEFTIEENAKANASE